MIHFFRRISLKFFYRAIIFTAILLSCLMFFFAFRTEQVRQQIQNNAFKSHQLLQELKSNSSISQTIQTQIEQSKNEIIQLEISQKNNTLYLEICTGFNLMFAILAFIFVNRDLKHLQELSQQVNRILAGDYTVRNKITIENEHGLLANTLNEMSQSILDKINEQEKTTLALKENEERFRSMVENSPIGTGIATLDGRFVFVNNSFCELLGYTREKLLTMEIKDITHPEDMPKESILLQQLIDEKIPFFRLYKRHIHKDGHSVWTLLNVTTIKSQGKPKYLTGQLQDVTERIQDEKRMAELNKSLISANNELKQAEREESLINKMNELLQICLNSTEAYPRISFIAKQLFPEFSGALSILNKSTKKIELVEEWGDEKISSQSFLPNDCLMIRSGNAITIDDSQKSIICSHYTTRPHGGIIGLPMIVHGDIIGVMDLFSPAGKNISEKQQNLAIILSNTVKTALANIRLRELLHEQATHDAITGLYNRQHLEAVLPHLLEQNIQHKSSLSLAFLELNSYQQLHLTYGQEVINEVLKYISTILSANLRITDLAGHFVQEQFLIIMPHTTLNEAMKKMQLVCDEIKSTQLYFKGNVLASLNISIGVATAPEQATKLESLVLIAEEALYLAKQSGKNCVECYQKQKEHKT